MNEKVKERSEQTDENRKWPWDWKNEALTETALTKIRENLSSYANDAVYREPEEVGMTDDLNGTFYIYCQVVKEDFQQAVKKATAVSVKQGLTAIANEAFELVDLLVEWVEKQIRRREGDFNMRYLPIDYPCSYTQISTRWGTVVRKFNMCKISGEQQEKSAETWGNATSAKIINIENFRGILADDVQAEIVQTGDHSSIHKQPTTREKRKGILIRILKIIGAIVGFLAALFTCLGYLFGWLGPIKAFIYNILWPK